MQAFQLGVIHVLLRLVSASSNVRGQGLYGPRVPSSRSFSGALGALTALGALATANVALAAAPEPVSAAQAQAILFGSTRATAPAACAAGEERARVECLLRARFSTDARAAQVAVELYQRSGTVVGLLEEQLFDGEYRGRIRMVPRLPVGALRHHLEWVAGGLAALDAFFLDLGRSGQLAFRWTALDVRFFESVRRRTPSAFASGWTVAYNVSGSLFRDADAVTQSLLHEIFHLNDFAHGGWSRRALTDLYDAVVARCGTQRACLARYSPTELIVRGGTYYAFMPDNGVVEYGAVLAERYFLEHRALARGARLPGLPFKCRAPENAQAWARLSREFFGGVDRTPPCPEPRREGPP